MINHVLVIGQFLAMLICVIPFAGMAGYNPLWWIVGAPGAMLAGWALMINRPGNFHVAPKVKEGGSLATTGPYRLVRHPMYTAVFFLGAGLALAAGHWLNGVGFLLVLVVFLMKIEVEEKNLHRHYGEDWERYATGRKKVLPGIY